MNLVYTTNESFCAKVAASICSVFENNRQEEEIIVYIIGQGLLQESCEHFWFLGKMYNREIQIIYLNDVYSYFDFKFDTGGWNPIVLARLVLDKLLPTCVNKVLYLDGDTINLEALTDLWNVDMQDKVIGACIEATVDKKHREEIGMGKMPYVNAGVLLIDLEKWRECEIGNRILRYYNENYENLTANDQDAINGALKGRILFLDPKYNYYNIYWFYPYKLLRKLMGQSFYYSFETVSQASKHPAIIHYLGEERPWRKGNRHKYRDEYEKYLQKTPWKNEKMEEGWELYFVFWNIFNVLIRPFPELRYQIINHLIPVMMKWRSKQLKKKKAITKG